MSLRTDLVARQREDRTFDFTIDTTEAVTGWTVTFTALPRDGAGTISRGASLLDAVTKTFRVTLTSLDLTVTAGVWFYDLARVNPGARAELAAGSLTVLPARTP